MQSKIGAYDADQAETKSANYLQISVGNDSRLYDLDRKVPREIWLLEDTNRFGADPEVYIETGFNLIFTTDDGVESIVQPNDQFTAYTIKNNLKQNKSIVYKCCDEIDLN